MKSRYQVFLCYVDRLLESIVSTSNISNCIASFFSRSSFDENIIIQVEIVDP